MCKLIKSKKSQQIFVSMMVSVLILITLLIIVNPLKTEIEKSINGSGSGNLSTANPNITIPNKAAVIIIDLSLFYFVAILVACSIAYISGRNSFVGIVTSIMMFMIVSVLINPLKTLIVLGRDAAHLDCANATIGIGARLSCIFLDVWLFVFVVTCLFVAATYIFIKTVPKK